MTAELRFLRAERFLTCLNESAQIEYRKSANKGHAAAQYKYGYMLSRGLVKEANFKKGMRYIRRSAMQGYGEAILELARGYYYGFGVKRNLRRAVRAWRLGAKLKISEAEYYLGLAYFKGEGVKRNKKKAEILFEKAKTGGFSGAI